MTKQAPGNSPIMFSGRGRSRRLVEAVKAQRLVSGDESLASRMLQKGKVESYARGAILLRQGDADNRLLFVLSGAVNVLINGRQVATREAGQHIGEMALVDVLQRRSATVIAAEDTTVLALSEPHFTALATSTPTLWRRVAVEIAARLRERSAAVRQPNDSPVVFIGSSAESLAIASEVHRQLDNKAIVARLWTDGVFQASRTAIESLVTLASSADFACLVLSADDVTVSRGRRVPSPRDNVVFELGLLIGSLGRERVFLLKPKGVDVRIPSDLLGVVWLEYARGGPVKLSGRMRAACSSVLKAVRAVGPR